MLSSIVMASTQLAFKSTPLLVAASILSVLAQLASTEELDLSSDLPLETRTTTKEFTSTFDISYSHNDDNKTDIAVNNVTTTDYAISIDNMFIFMSIVYSISTLSAIVTNLIVILVYLFVQKTKTDLSLFLINLAVADFLAGTFCMPFSFAQVLLRKWIFGDALCTLGKFYRAIISMFFIMLLFTGRYKNKK